MERPEIRKDYFRNQYVIIAANRAKRPQQIKKDENEYGKFCYFCPDNIGNKVITLRENNEKGDWQILSFINDFPCVSLDNPKSYGQAEVLIETRQHGPDVNDFSIKHIVKIIDAYINRYDSLMKIEGVKHVIIFKNEGGKAGASIAHTHSQIIALPIMPPKVEHEMNSYRKYRQEKQTCPLCDIIKNEMNGPRVIFEDKFIFAAAPYASESPYGAWIIPKRHVKKISDLSLDEKESIAKVLKQILGKLDEMGISYNYFIENAVVYDDYHMNIKISPRPNIWAGLELGTGVIVNSIAPERAAAIYRGEEEI
jgi:UDPglucose--hexose-1-phosphate uridylyltransferase